MPEIVGQSPNKFVGYAGIGAGFGIGYLMNGMFIKLSDRIMSLVDTAFSGSSRSEAGAVAKVDWKSWIAWLVAVAIWGGIALWGFNRWRSKNGFGDGLIFGVGLGGAVEEIFHVPGGV